MVTGADLCSRRRRAGKDHGHGEAPQTEAWEQSDGLRAAEVAVDQEDETTEEAPRNEEQPPRRAEAGHSTPSRPIPMRAPRHPTLLDLALAPSRKILRPFTGASVKIEGGCAQPARISRPSSSAGTRTTSRVGGSFSSGRSGPGDPGWIGNSSVRSPAPPGRDRRARVDG